MDWLNYHHLYYFWTVVREGGVTAASRKLRLAQPTISGQLKQLEDALGEKLFVREGRKLALTDPGRVVYRYAEEIFSLGRELVDAVKDRPTGKPMRFTVGVADVVPKAIAHRLLEPALRMPVHLICREDRPERLVADLALHEVDLVITDAPVSPQVRVKAYHHLLGESGVAFFAERALARKLARNFPRSLHGAPLLLPAEGTNLRRGLDAWFDREGIRPNVVGEFQDSALTEAFGLAGAGVFAVPAAVADRERHGVQELGRIDSIRERFYAVTVERRIVHPAVVAIFEAARSQLFV